MRTKIPVRFLVILLIADFAIGSALVYQNAQTPILPIDGKLCEQGKLYQFLGREYDTFPIRYSFDSALPERFYEGIQNGIDEWNSIVQGNIFVEATTRVGKLIITYGSISGKANNPTALAVAQSWLRNEFSTAIDRSIITFNSAKDFKDLKFSCELLPQDFEGPFDILSIATHEIGHVLGLDHTNDEFTTMFDYYSGTFAQTLSQGEIDGFFRLYPQFSKAI